MAKRGPPKGCQGHPSPRRGKGEAIKWLREHTSYTREDCLPWPFARTPEGYGSMGHEGVMYRAHRKMCELVNGPPPDPSYHAAHSCGHGHLGCINPRHLSWKTPTDNQIDRIRHGTDNGSILSGSLKAEEIEQIRSLKGIKTQYELAAMFGVKRGAIQYWHRHNDPPKSPGTSKRAEYRRLRAARSA